MGQFFETSLKNMGEFKSSILRWLYMNKEYNYNGMNGGAATWYLMLVQMKYIRHDEQCSPWPDAELPMLKCIQVLDVSMGYLPLAIFCHFLNGDYSAYYQRTNLPIYKSATLLDVYEIPQYLRKLKKKQLIIYFHVFKHITQYKSFGGKWKQIYE